MLHDFYHSNTTKVMPLLPYGSNSKDDTHFCLYQSICSIVTGFDFIQCFMEKVFEKIFFKTVCP